MFRAGWAVVLSRRCAECQRHLPERSQKRKRRGQVHDQAANRAHDASAQLQQAFPQRPNLSSRTAGVRGVQAQLLHQHVGGGGQQDAELVGPEAAATGAVDLKIVQLSR
jgi:hypothetical protein